MTLDEIIKNIPEVKALLAQHPDYDIQIVHKINKIKTTTNIKYNGIEHRTTSRKQIPYLISATNHGKVAVSSELPTKAILEKLKVAQSILDQPITPERTAALNAVSKIKYKNILGSSIQTTYDLYDVMYAIFDGANDETWCCPNPEGSFHLGV